MDKLIAGVNRFRRSVYPESRGFFQQLAAKQQKPIALFITCADSRIHPNLITQTEPGELFLLRNAGNIVPPHGAGGGEAATIEYSVEVLGIRQVVICGHSQCGAIQALLDGERLGHVPAVKAWCHHAEAARRIVQQKYRSLTPAALAVAAAKENVLVQMNHLTTHPSVAAHLAGDDLRIFGWYYDIGAGEISQYDPALGRFVPLSGEVQLEAPARALATGAEADEEPATPTA
jgi:carbonic anhydrase